MPEICDAHEAMRHDVSEAAKSSAITALAVVRIEATATRIEAANAKYQHESTRRIERAEQAMNRWRWWTGGVASCISFLALGLGLAVKFGWI